MKSDYSNMSDADLLAELYKRYADFNLNDKNRLREILQEDDGLLTEFFYKSSIADS